jgi:hypothetical protein
MKISLCFPTLGRTSRVSRLVNFYSGIDNPNLEILVSFNGPLSEMSIPSFVGSTTEIKFVENVNLPYRIGNNMHSCLSKATGDLIILVSDEDLIIGVEALTAKACDDVTDIISLKMINDYHISRRPPATDLAHDFIFNNHGYLSGVGFKREILQEVDLSMLLKIENNDYFHILLMIILADRGFTFGYLPFPIVYKEIERYEEDFLVRRKDWFSIDGRIAQAKSYKSIMQNLRSGELLHLLNITIPNHIADGVITTLDMDGVKALPYIMRKKEVNLRVIFISLKIKIYRIFVNFARNVYRKLKSTPIQNN